MRRNRIVFHLTEIASFHIFFSHVNILHTYCTSQSHNMIDRTEHRFSYEIYLLHVIRQKGSNEAKIREKGSKAFSQSYVAHVEKFIKNIERTHWYEPWSML